MGMQMLKRYGRADEIVTIILVILLCKFDQNCDQNMDPTNDRLPVGGGVRG
jgi:hypothetical protein